MPGRLRRYRTTADRVLLALKRAGAERLRTMLRLQTVKPPSPVPLPTRRRTVRSPEA